MLETLFGAEVPFAARFFISFLIVLGLLGVTTWTARRFKQNDSAAAANDGEPRVNDDRARLLQWLPLAISLCAVIVSLCALLFAEHLASPPESSGGVDLTDAAADAARAVLYEEDPNDPQGRRFAGSVVWRTDSISPGEGKPSELAVRADIEVPGRKLGMTWTLRSVSEDGASASHTIDIIFKLPPDFPPGGIFNVPGVWMKTAEQAQGTALAGQSVKVTTGYFLIGLSGAPADRDRNIQLLKERIWFDMPIVYTNSLRAILAMEKGLSGKRAFAEVLNP